MDAPVRGHNTMKKGCLVTFEVSHRIATANTKAAIRRASRNTGST